MFREAPDRPQQATRRDSSHGNLNNTDRPRNNNNNNNDNHKKKENSRNRSVNNNRVFSGEIHSNNKNIASDINDNVNNVDRV